jgi:hypothetical protein
MIEPAAIEQAKQKSAMILSAQISELPASRQRLNVCSGNRMVGKSEDGAKGRSVGRRYDNLLTDPRQFDILEIRSWLAGSECSLIN